LKVNLENLLSIPGVDAYIWLDENLSYLSSNLDNTQYSLDSLLEISQKIINDNSQISNEGEFFLLVERGILYSRRLQDKSCLFLVAGHKDSVSLLDLRLAIKSIDTQLSLQ
jgi:hypothetical protein